MSDAYLFSFLAAIPLMWVAVIVLRAIRERGDDDKEGRP